jgi:16S rRNA (guanine966-N2)-methyltransferase
MNVISGKYKGKRLKTLKGDAIRPSTGMIRESVFNILQEDIQGKTFVDLFAGNGCVGIEALSRGANKAVFVDADKRAIGVIKENIRNTGIEEPCRVLHSHVETGLGLIARDEPDIIFMDPPYPLINKDFITSILKNIVKLEIMMPSDLIILQSQADFKTENLNVPELTLTKDRKYGRSRLTFWEIA